MAFVQIGGAARCDCRKLMASSSSDKEHDEAVKAMKELVEAIKAESARRIAKLDAIFNDNFQATIKNTENMAIEMQNKAMMFEKILRTQTLIKRRTKETEFERSMKVLKKKAECVVNKETLGMDSCTTTVKDTSDVHEGSDTSTTMKKSSDVDSKCSAGGGTSLDDKEVMKSGIVTTESENKQPTSSVAANSTPRTKRFSFRGIGEATLHRLGQWRRNAARILHLSRSSREEPRRRATKKRYSARTKGRATRRRRPQGKSAAANANSSSASKIIYASRIPHQHEKMHLHKPQCPKSISSSDGDKQQSPTGESASGAHNADSSSSPSSNNCRIENNPRPKTRSSTARESGLPTPSVTGTSPRVNSFSDATTQQTSKHRHRLKEKANKTKRNKKIYEVRVTSTTPEQSSSEGKRPDIASTDQQDNTSQTAKPFNDCIKKDEKNETIGSNERTTQLWTTSTTGGDNK
uniref:Shugoshin C-terminal domain-containing protein n=1 Tax=Parascaris univalens TaxID=6257 RepID=A0A915A6X3_PARUN